MFNYFAKPDPKENIRENEKVLRKVGRDIERERRELEKEERKIELEIKKLSKEGNKEGCMILARQLIQLRKQKTRTYTAGNKVQNVGLQNKTMGTSLKLAGAMGATTRAMSDMNKLMRPEQVAANARAFGQAAMKMDMTDEMINDSLDDILVESGDEEDSDNIISQVLDEIGLEVSGKMQQAPTTSDKIPGQKSNIQDDEILAQLAKLKS